MTRTGKESASMDGFDSLDEDGRAIVISYMYSVPLKCPWQMSMLNACMVFMKVAILTTGNSV